jgi:hypothetical protein
MLFAAVRESVVSTKRTSHLQSPMYALGGKADVFRSSTDVAF